MKMNEIDIIESNISLLKTSIDFEEIIDDCLSEIFSESEISEMDLLGYRRDKISQLQYRFSNIYNLDILTPENGFSILNIDESENYKIKKYLHRFLSYKSITGGECANSDGSARLFELISANAVKNYLGSGAETIMVGEGKEALTKERLKEITDILNERDGLTHNLPKMAKDDGVDFIVYKNLDIRNVGNIIILGQACVGRHYKNKKTIRDRWKDEYIGYSIKPPLTLLSIVYYLDESNLKRVHSDFNNSIIFDKGRIIKYYNTADVILNDEIISFVDREISDE
jgi:hypothetical protein